MWVGMSEVVKQLRFATKPYEVNRMVRKEVRIARMADRRRAEERLKQACRNRDPAAVDQQARHLGGRGRWPMRMDMGRLNE